jgi:hypothetical protein
VDAEGLSFTLIGIALLCHQIDAAKALAFEDCNLASVLEAIRKFPGVAETTDTATFSIYWRQIVV